MLSKSVETAGILVKHFCLQQALRIREENLMQTHAGETSPVSGVVFEFEEDVKDVIIGNHREGGRSPSFWLDGGNGIRKNSDLGRDA